MKIVLISMDCIRSDYIGNRHFDELFKNAVSYRKCITAASHTSTSHTTMLTGTYPFKHGVRWLVRYSIKDKMLQEILKENGFRTGAFIGGFPLTQGDMDRSFDIFNHEPLIDDRDEGRSKFVPANILVQKAANFLNEDGGDAFVFIHFFDAHLTLRSEFDAHHPPPEKDEEGVYIHIEKYLGRRKRRYIEEIEFIGAQIKRLTELSDIDLLVITADHGEKMQGEKGYPWVSNHKGESVGSHFHEVELYDHQLLVPLIFWGKDITRAEPDNMVRTVDIAPTILEKIGYKDKELGRMDGVSLWGQINGREAPHIEDAYSETYFAQMHAKNQHASEMNMKYRWGWKAIDNLVSLRTPTHKLICLANGRLEPIHLYDLSKDPGENNNLISEETHGPLINALFYRLKEMIGDDTQFSIDSKKEESSRVRAAIGKLKLK